MRARHAAIGLVLAAACGGDDGGSAGLTGVVRYEDRPQMSNGRLGSIQTLPARGVQLSLIAEDDGAVLYTTVTGDDGSYEFPTEGADVESVHLMAAAVSMSAERPIEVVNQQRQVHGFGGPVFMSDAGTQDLLITDASGASEAFNVFDQCVINADAIRLQLGVTPVKLTAIWYRGSDDGTYYIPGNHEMHLLGASSDDDGYDDTVILHEAGHFVEDTVGRSDSPGGFHDGSPTDPRLAWSEGFSTYWSMAAINMPFYGDSNSGGGWGYNAETSNEGAPQPTGNMSQQVGENLITEILWDMGDGAEDDQLAGDQIAVRMVQPMYLRTASLRNVGVAGVDLVDFLDGWFSTDGLGKCAAVRSIVTTSRGFPYDYAGPGGSCP